MKKTLLVIIAALVLIAIPLQAQGKIVLKFGHGHTATHSYQLGMEQAKKMLEEKTGGRMTMQFYPSNQLGDERHMQEALSVGTQDLAITGLVNLYDPAFALFDFPFQYANRDQIKAVMYSPLMDKMNEALIKKGIRIVGLLEVGFRNVTSKKPIKSPADLKGFKIRTPESPAQVETFKALGALPTPMPFGELYGALQQGVVDGQENPLENIYNGKLYEVQKYVIETRHIYNFGYVLVSERTWQKLSADDQKALKEAVKFGSFWQIDWAQENEAKYAQMLKDKGMEFIQVDREAFRKGAEAAYQSKFVRDLEPRASSILQEIRTIISTVK
jgi:tripartite ATP-independent transporter DctP family solute receptor